MNERRKRMSSTSIRKWDFEENVTDQDDSIDRRIENRFCVQLVKDIWIKPGKRERERVTQRNLKVFFSVYLIDGGGVKSEKYWWSVSLIALQICWDGDVVHSTRHG